LASIVRTPGGPLLRTGARRLRPTARRAETPSDDGVVLREGPHSGDHVRTALAHRRGARSMGRQRRPRVHAAEPATDDRGGVDVRCGGAQIRVADGQGRRRATGRRDGLDTRRGRRFDRDRSARGLARRPADGRS
jgi:hypothetical protein